MSTVNEVALKLLIDGKEYQGTLDDFDKTLKESGRTGQKSGRSIKEGFTAAKIGILAAAAAVTAIIIGLNKVVNIASEFQEANSKMLVVFKGVEAGARSMRDELVNSYFMSYNEATKLLGATGDMLTGFGMTSKKALELSGDVNRLAADIASFSNVEGGAVMVSDALTKGLLGEREALKTYGIAIDEAMVKEQLRLKGLDKLTGMDLKAARAEVTLALAYKQSKNAVGDLERTQDSYANTQRRVSAATENLALQLGAVFLPIWNKVLSAVLELLDFLNENNISGILFATWEAFKMFGERLYNLFTGVSDLVTGIFTLDFEKIKDGVKGLWEAVSGDVQENIDRLKTAYDEGGKAFEEFMQGSVAASAAAQEEMTRKQAVELDKRTQKSLKKHQDFMDMVEKEVRDFGEAQTEKGEAYKDLVDFQFENDLISHEAWTFVMEERLLTAQLIYGMESMEYQKLLIAKTKGDKDYATGKTKGEKIAAKQYGGFLAQNLNTFKGTSKTMFDLWKGGAKIQAIVDAYAAANAAYKALAGIPIVGPILAGIAGAGALAFGFANVASINAQKFALGGMVPGPTLGLLGEAGPEIIAPKKTFIDVQNELIRSGQVGSSDVTMLREIRGLRAAIENQELVAELDDEGLSIAVERGDQDLSTRDY